MANSLKPPNRETRSEVPLYLNVSPLSPEIRFNPLKSHTGHLFHPRAPFNSNASDVAETPSSTSL